MEMKIEIRYEGMTYDSINDAARAEIRHLLPSISWARRFLAIGTSEYDQQRGLSEPKGQMVDDLRGAIRHLDEAHAALDSIIGLPEDLEERLGPVLAEGADAYRLRERAAAARIRDLVQRIEAAKSMRAQAQATDGILDDMAGG